MSRGILFPLLAIAAGFGSLSPPSGRRTARPVPGPNPAAAGDEERRRQFRDEDLEVAEEQRNEKAKKAESKRARKAAKLRATAERGAIEQVRR